MRSFRRALFLICLCLCSSGCVAIENIVEIIHPDVDLIGNEQDNLIDYSLPIINDESVYVEIADTDKSEEELYLDLKLISKAKGTAEYFVEITSINSQRLSVKWHGEVSDTDMETVRLTLSKSDLSKYGISDISSVSLEVNGYRTGYEQPFVSESASVTLQK